MMRSWSSLRATVLSSFRNQKFETIVSCIDELNDEAYNSAKLVSENIEKAIKSSVDMGELKQELDNQEQPDYYCDILERETKNVSLNRVKNTRNGILILNNSGIVFGDLFFILLISHPPLYIFINMMFLELFRVTYI